MIHEALEALKAQAVPVPRHHHLHQHHLPDHRFQDFPFHLYCLVHQLHHHLQLCRFLQEHQDLPYFLVCHLLHYFLVVLQNLLLHLLQADQPLQILQYLLLHHWHQLLPDFQNNLGALPHLLFHLLLVTHQHPINSNRLFFYISLFL